MNHLAVVSMKKPIFLINLQEAVEILSFEERERERDYSKQSRKTTHHKFGYHTIA